MTDLQTYRQARLPAHTEEAIHQARERARSARSAATLRAYDADWRDFAAACERLGFPAEPTAEIVSVYLDQLARDGARASTIRRRLSSLNTRRRALQLEPLSSREEPLASVLRGIMRAIGAPPRQARPLEIEELRQIVTACPETLQGKRDRALLLVGFAGAFRRSELAGLDWDRGGDGTAYVEFVREGVRITLKRSKTNQMGDFEQVAICHGQYASTCPVKALEAWRDATSGEGPVFRSVSRHGRLGLDRLDGKSVARIVRAAATRAAVAGGASPDEVMAALERLSGHSLRSGLVTTAFAAGLTSEDVMRQTRHKNVKTLLGYRRHATAFVANVSGKVGL